MSFQPAIPQRGALQQSPPPLHQPSQIMRLLVHASRLDYLDWHFRQQLTGDHCHFMCLTDGVRSREMNNELG
jgi:hypothetical protein